MCSRLETLSLRVSCKEQPVARAKLLILTCHHACMVREEVDKAGDGLLVKLAFAGTGVLVPCVPSPHTGVIGGEATKAGHCALNCASPARVGDTKPKDAVILVCGEYETPYTCMYYAVACPRFVNILAPENSAKTLHVHEILETHSPDIEGVADQSIALAFSAAARSQAQVLIQLTGWHCWYSQWNELHSSEFEGRQADYELCPD